MKKLSCLLLAVLCLFNLAGCAYMTYSYKEDGIRSVLIQTETTTHELQKDRTEWETLVTFLMKDADIDGKGRPAESDYAADTRVVITMKDAVYTYYVDWEGNIVRVLNGTAMEVYNTRLAEDILQEIKRLLP